MRASFLNGSFLKQNGRRWQVFIAGNRRSRSGHRSMHILADMRQRKSWQQLRRRQSEKGLSRYGGDSGTDGRDGAAASKCAETPGAGAAAVSGKYCGAFGAFAKAYEAAAAGRRACTGLDTLYRMASGNVSGARMDLETYVQRYYLEKILQSANCRFYEMSAGQFELRMYELEKAGEGKNRGLDLMVYSNVTGKEREVRTLSGGESFMAALSLALGMADQIQESSSAIRLDMMFIDEGFGSLDEHSRSQAVRVLQKMAAVPD